MEIKETKASIKAAMQEHKYAGNLQSKLISLRYEFRHKHIAYCMLRGKKLEQIEKGGHKTTPSGVNNPYISYVNKLMEQYGMQTVCSC